MWERAIMVLIKYVAMPEVVVSIEDTNCAI